MNQPGVEGTSTRPYLIRALHEWCVDNGFSPYLAVHVDASVRVPKEYVKNSEIVLNVSVDAVNALVLGNEYIEFKARFGGVVREIMVPVSHVVAIYARENGQGMAFPAPQPAPQPELQEEPPADATADRPADEVPQDLDGESAASTDPGREPLRSVPRDPPAPDASGSATETNDDPAPGGQGPGGGRPALKRVK